MKYWNRRRIERKKARERMRHERTRAAAAASAIKRRMYTSGDCRTNARLMLAALGNETHRKMLVRLRTHGAMSVSHLAEPFRIMLPDALRHVHLLERAGLITTEKRGRIRFCIYNPNAPKELATWLATARPFDVD